MALAKSLQYVLTEKNPTAIYSDGTSVWIGNSSGQVIKYTLATGAKVGTVIQVAEKITALVVTSTHLYIGTDKGKVYSFVLSSAVYESAPLDLGKRGYHGAVCFYEYADYCHKRRRYLQLHDIVTNFKEDIHDG